MSGYFLYRIVVPDGKAYIGYSKSPQIRFDQHCNADSAIGAAIRRHGRDKCRLDILLEGSQFDMRDQEQLHMRLCKTRYPQGYNDAPAPSVVAGRAAFLEDNRISSPTEALGDTSGVDAIFTPAETPEKRTNAGWIEMTTNSDGRRAIERVFPDYVFQWQLLQCPREGWRSTVAHLPRLAQRCSNSLQSELIGLSRLAAMDDEELACLMAEAVRHEGARATWRPSNRTAVHPFFQKIAPANGGASHRDSSEDVP